MEAMSTRSDDDEDSENKIVDPSDTRTSQPKNGLSRTQQWEQDQAERSKKALAESRTERERRAGMSAEQLRVEDAKREHKTLSDAEDLAAMNDDERKKHLDKHSPVPPWQLRLLSGKVFDVRAQEPIQFVATDGTALDGHERRAALEFYAAYITDPSTIV